jgi:hypothetical protein
MIHRPKPAINLLTRSGFSAVGIFVMTAFQPTLATSAFYVDPMGDDHSGIGTDGQPWKTLGQACKKVLKPGSVIHLGPGHYIEKSSCRLAPGVSVVGAGIDATILHADFDDWLIQAQSNFINESGQTLENFSIDGNRRALKGGAVFKNRSKISVREVRFRGLDTAGLQITGTDGSVEKPPKWFLDGVVVQHNEFENCAKDYGTWSGGCLQIGGLKGGIVSDNVVTEDQGAGIKQWGGGWFLGTRVENNRVRVPHLDKAWGADISIELWNVQDGCVVANNQTNGWISIVKGQSNGVAKSVYVSGNRIVIESLRNVKEGLEIAGIDSAEIFENQILGAKFAVGLWESRPGTGNSNIFIHHNVFGGRTDGEGIRIHSGNSVRIMNNLFFGLEKALGLHTNRSKISDIRFANNLVVDTKHGIVLIANAAPIEGLQADTNEYVRVQQSAADWSSAKFKSTWQEVINQRMHGPLAISSSGAYTLDSNSPLIDAGTPSDLPFCGDAPDIGPREWCPDSQP